MISLQEAPMMGSPRECQAGLFKLGIEEAKDQMSSQPQPPMLGSGSNVGSNKTDDAALKLYMLEYERCAIRYEDIYKAIWTNFSYMAILAGGILTFGRERFQLEVSALIAFVPLFFWYLATFEPLNRYGDQVVGRLSEIEEIFKTKYNAELRHFTDFKNQSKKIRVRYVVRSCFILLFLCFLSVAFLQSLG